MGYQQMVSYLIGCCINSLDFLCHHYMWPSFNTYGRLKCQRLLQAQTQTRKICKICSPFSLFSSDFTNITIWDCGDKFQHCFSGATNCCCLRDLCNYGNFSADGSTTMSIPLNSSGFSKRTQPPETALYLETPESTSEPQSFTVTTSEPQNFTVTVASPETGNGTENESGLFQYEIQSSNNCSLCFDMFLIICLCSVIYLLS